MRLAGSRGPRRLLRLILNRSEQPGMQGSSRQSRAACAARETCGAVRVALGEQFPNGSGIQPSQELAREGAVFRRSLNKRKFGEEHDQGLSNTHKGSARPIMGLSGITSIERDRFIPI